MTSSWRNRIQYYYISHALSCRSGAFAAIFSLACRRGVPAAILSRLQFHAH